MRRLVGGRTPKSGTLAEVPQPRLFGCFILNPGGRLRVSFFCVAKRKSPKKRPPSIAPFGFPALLTLCGGLSTGHPWPAKDERHPCGARLSGAKLFAETGARTRHSTLPMPGAAANSRTGRTANRVASVPAGLIHKRLRCSAQQKGLGVPDSISVGFCRMSIVYRHCIQRQGGWSWGFFSSR
jgi:hypothetical protein